MFPADKKATKDHMHRGPSPHLGSPPVISLLRGFFLLYEGLRISILRRLVRCPKFCCTNQLRFVSILGEHQSTKYQSAAVCVVIGLILFPLRFPVTTNPS